MSPAWSAQDKATTATAPAQSPVLVQAETDRTQMVIGDMLKYSLRVVWPDTLEQPVVQPGLTLGEFEIVNADQGPVENAGAGHSAKKFTFELSTFDTGDFEIPPFTIAYRSPDGLTTGTVRTPPVKITVKGVAAAESGTDVRDFKPPAIIAPDNRLRNALIAGGAVLALAIAFLIWWLRQRAQLARRRYVAPLAPPRPAEVVALEALDQLARNLPQDREEAMLFYVKLSEIIRVFLGRRFDFEAMDRTTYEIMDFLFRMGLESQRNDQIESFFNACDLVKFAKFPADREQASAAIEEARRIVADNPPAQPPPLPAQPSAPQTPTTPPSPPPLPPPTAPSPQPPVTQEATVHV
ncbi:MAG: BatD family protein [Candidatus Sumerlaeota bacterium]|nr:BatD family protein [Candidatus Sumerlaeota bacterium]